MPRNWSRAENEATVQDYLAMLEEEQSGLRYNKSEHRRRLAQLLDNRSEAAIELKHQNISAVLIARHVPYIRGYLPRGNYQRDLAEVVDDVLGHRTELETVLRLEAAKPVALPTMDHILSSLVDAPVVKEFDYRKAVRELPPIRRSVDYVALEAANRSLGDLGEEFVLRFEKARLAAARQERLAAAVERVSVTRGDGLGYDVLSFEANGRERLVEVKTTSYGAVTPFFVTRNEVEVSKLRDINYHLYRVFDFRESPRLFQLAGRIDQAFALDPVQFIARLRTP